MNYSALAFMLYTSITASTSFATKVTVPIGLSTSQGVASSRNLRSSTILAELPSELVELIQSVEQSDQNEKSKESVSDRYFATYALDGSLCSSKIAASFESWEESFASLEECCEMAFSWDMDKCLNRRNE
jgi:hypothetical protein